MKQTMRDFIAEDDSFVKEEAGQTITIEEFKRISNEDIAAYNQNITNLDEDFTSLKPTMHVLVRVYLKELEEKNGILIPDYEILYGNTRNDMPLGIKVEDPYPFKYKAIVVATPQLSYELSFNVGDIVSLSKTSIDKVILGKGDDAYPTVRNAFIHPDRNTTSVSVDPKDKDYGYLKVNIADIEFIL